MKKRLLILIIIILLFNVLLNIRTLNYDFLKDDYILILNNNRIKEFNKLLESFSTPFFTFPHHQYLHYWRPFILFTFYIDYKLWGINPSGYHLSNIFFHSLNCILIFLIIFMLSKNIKFSFLTSIFFSIHPAHIENITWISGRTDLIVMFFLLFSFVFLIKFISKNILSYLILSIAAFCFALMSKEIAILFPVFLLIVFFQLKIDKNQLLYLTPFFLCCIIFLFFHQNITSSEVLFKNLSLNNAWVTLKTIGAYFQINFFPIFPAPFFSMHSFDKFTILYLFLFLAFILFILFIIKYRHKFKFTFFSFPLFIFLLPILNPKIVPSYPNISLRFIYIFSILFSIFASELFCILGKNKKLFFITNIILLILIFGYTIKYFNYQTFFINEKTYFSKMNKAYPVEETFILQLSYLKANKGKYYQALSLVKKALKINKKNPWINFQGKGKIFKVNLLILTKQYKKAKNILQAILKNTYRKEHKYFSYLLYSKYYEKKKDIKKALNMIRKAEFFGETAKLFYTKAILYSKIKNYKKALASLEQAKNLHTSIENYKDFKIFLLNKIKAAK